MGKAKPITVKSFVHDREHPGQWKPVESLSPEEFAAFRKFNSETMAKTLALYYSRHFDEI